LQHVMANESGEFRERLERTCQSLIEQIDSLAAIANEFSNFAQLPGTKLQKINLSEVISASVSLFEQHRQIEISSNLQSPLFVLGDREQSHRIFNNILNNSVQALSETEKPYIRINLESQDENKVVISVEDNGCGIDETLRDKIFTPSFTTKSTGSGLGLAMVKSIMESFGGRIWFTSKTGAGTAFYLEFQRAEINPQDAF
jgi:two-component system nitrogen regulation sensor histidine kinase NtrY